ncbi:MAG: hypothetical protein ABS977_09135 [Pseudomonas qingdaonensis]|uniref:hypothetical protein n=1 Tax=Pseudomonas qingdaonensis TaxID=2056231 RepID=UPI003315C31D
MTPFETQSTSPDGRYRIEAAPWEAGNSHWVYPPRIVDAVSGACLFEFQDQRWSLDRAAWLSDTQVELMLRKYPGQLTGEGVRVRVDCAGRVARCGEGAGVELADLERALERHACG